MTVAPMFTVTEGADRWDREITPYPSYNSVASMVGRVVYEKTCGSYQGEIVFGLKNRNGTPGILVVGYGSCSYCDSMQAAQESDDPVRDLTAIFDQMAASVVWGKRALKAKEWEASWYYYDREMRDALNEALAAVGVDLVVEFEDEDD